MRTLPESSARDTTQEGPKPSETITEAPEESTQRPSLYARYALALRKKGMPMWAIYVAGWTLVIVVWVFFAAVLPETQRPLVNVAGCALLAIGGFTIAIAKSEPLYTGKRESSAHTKWRSPAEDISYFAVLIGAIFVLVAAVKDPAFLNSWGTLMQGIGIVHGPQTPQ